MSQVQAAIGEKTCILCRNLAFHKALEQRQKYRFWSALASYPELYYCDDVDDVPTCYCHNYIWNPLLKASLFFEWSWRSLPALRMDIFPKRNLGVPFSRVNRVQELKFFLASSKAMMFSVLICTLRLREWWHKQTRSRFLQGQSVIYQARTRPLIRVKPKTFASYSCQFIGSILTIQTWTYFSHFSSRKRKARVKSETSQARHFNLTRTLEQWTTSAEIEVLFMCYQSTYANAASKVI